jgi:hypothetical protein
MTRNEMLQSFLLGFGLEAGNADLGRPTTFAELWREAKGACFSCDPKELLDALYTMPREHVSLIKMVSTGEGAHPVSFERVRNVSAWPDYFTSSTFNVKVLPAGKRHYEQVTEQAAQPGGR